MNSRSVKRRNWQRNLTRNSKFACTFEPEVHLRVKQKLVVCEVQIMRIEEAGIKRLT